MVPRWRLHTCSGLLCVLLGSHVLCACWPCGCRWVSPRHEQQVNRIFPKKKNTTYREGGNSHQRDILVCADHVSRKYPHSPGSSETPDAHNSALDDQHRDISELRHAKVEVCMLFLFLLWALYFLVFLLIPSTINWFPTFSLFFSTLP